MERPINVLAQLDLIQPQRFPFIVNLGSLTAYLIGDNISGVIMAQHSGMYVCVVDDMVRQTVQISILGEDIDLFAERSSYMLTMQYASFSP